MARRKKHQRKASSTSSCVCSFDFFRICDFESGKAAAMSSDDDEYDMDYDDDKVPRNPMNLPELFEDTKEDIDDNYHRISARLQRSDEHSEPMQETPRNETETETETENEREKEEAVETESEIASRKQGGPLDQLTQVAKTAASKTKKVAKQTKKVAKQTKSTLTTAAKAGIDKVGLKPEAEWPGRKKKKRRFPRFWKKT